MANTTKKAPARKKASNGAESHSQLENLFSDQLKDIYWAEKHLTKRITKNAEIETTGLPALRVTQLAILLKKRARFSFCGDKTDFPILVVALFAVGIFLFIKIIFNSMISYRYNMQ